MFQKLFWPFPVWINCPSDLKNFANSCPSASNCKSFSRSLEQFFLTIGQNNFGNKITFPTFLWPIWKCYLSYLNYQVLDLHHVLLVSQLPGQFLIFYAIIDFLKDFGILAILIPERGWKKFGKNCPTQEMRNKKKDWPKVPKVKDNSHQIIEIQKFCAYLTICFNICIKSGPSGPTGLTSRATAI